MAPFQVPFLQSLFGQGQALAGQQAGQIGGVAGPLAGALTGNTLGLLGGLTQQAGATPAQGAIDQLGAIGQGPIAQQLGQVGQGAPVGQDALQAILAGGAAGVPQAGAVGQAQVPGQQFDPNLGQLGPGVDVAGAFDARIGALGEDIQTQLGRTLGTLGSQAGLAGGFGGSRQALASGLAGEAAQRTFGREAGALRGQEAVLSAQLAQQQQALQNQRDIAGAGLGAQLGAQEQALGAGLAGATQQQQAAQAAQTQALGAGANQQQQAQQLAAALGIQQGGLQQGGLQGSALSSLLGQQFAGAGLAGQLGLGQAGAQQQAAQLGIGGAPTAFNLGLAPFAAQFSPLQNLAGILGPAILNQQSTGQSQSTGITRQQSGLAGLAGPLGGAIAPLLASFIPGGSLGLTAASGALDLLFSDSGIF